MDCANRALNTFKLLIGVFAALSASLARAETLTPQDVVNAVLAKSNQAEQIKLNAQNANISLERARGVFDFQFKMDARYTYDEAENLAFPVDNQYKSIFGDLALSKKTKYGASLELGYQHQADNRITSTPTLPNYVSDVGYLAWRQNLWNNMFGRVDRLNLEIAERQVSESDLTKIEDTEGLVLDSLRAYWNTYVAQTQLQDATEARERYQGLIKAVQRRGRFGLDKGGEYAQVMADAVEADTAVKNASITYLRLLSDLSIRMQQEFKADLVFKVDPLVPSVPKLQPVKIETLRSYRNYESQLETSRRRIETSRSAVAPKLDLVAKAASNGFDEKASAAYSELASGKKPTYQVGLEFAMPLDSSNVRAELAAADLDLAQKTLNAKVLLENTKSNLEISNRNVEQAFIAATNAVESEKFRARTVREQDVEYRNGRLPLFNLLDTYRKYFDSQARKVRAVGDYHIALNQLAADRDELVK